MFFLVIPDFPFVLMSKSRMSASSISSCISILILHCLFLKQKNKFKTGEKDFKKSQKYKETKIKRLKIIVNLQFTIYNVPQFTIQKQIQYKLGSLVHEIQRETKRDRARELLGYPLGASGLVP